MKTKKVYICSNCQSPDVEGKYWVGMNTGEIHDTAMLDDTDYWCNTCEGHHLVHQAELKEDAEVIGYQVVGEEGTDVEGKMHPDMAGSFCVYNLTWAQERVVENKWRILTIWKGDIEEPTFMYKGSTPDF